MAWKSQSVFYIQLNEEKITRIWWLTITYRHSAFTFFPCSCSFLVAISLKLHSNFLRKCFWYKRNQSLLSYSYICPDKKERVLIRYHLTCHYSKRMLSPHSWIIIYNMEEKLLKERNDEDDYLLFPPFVSFRPINLTRSPATLCSERNQTKRICSQEIQVMMPK